MRNALIATAVVFAFAAVAIGLYESLERPAPPPSAAVAASSPEARFAFTLLEEPRPVPDVSFVDGTGRAMTLADFQGKVVLLNIWATWCGPCREEMPTLDRLQAALGEPDFQAVALSIDRAGIEVVRDFYDEIGLKHLAMYVDSSGKASRDLGAVGLPTTLLLDREGRELGRLVGPAEWDSPEVVAFIRRHLMPEAASQTHLDSARTAKWIPPERPSFCLRQTPLIPKPRKGDDMRPNLNILLATSILVAGLVAEPVLYAQAEPAASQPPMMGQGGMMQSGPMMGNGGMMNMMSQMSEMMSTCNEMMKGMMAKRDSARPNEQWPNHAPDQPESKG